MKARFKKEMAMVNGIWIGVESKTWYDVGVSPIAASHEEVYLCYGLGQFVAVKYLELDDEAKEEYMMMRMT